MTSRSISSRPSPSRINHEPVSIITEIKNALRRHADQDAAVLKRFFKSGPGEYAEGDQFLGVRVPQTRLIAKRFFHLPFSNIETLLRSPWHEERLLALIILVEQYRVGTDREREKVFKFYLSHTRFINNWDLVDVSAPQIVGQHLEKRSRAILEKLARSKNLWERRIAIVSTYWFIAKGDCSTTFKVSKILMSDRHDLIHKAVGWMLREVGKKCGEKILEAFLREHLDQLPRTTLRYAIERFSKKKRGQYLSGRIET